METFFGKNYEHFRTSADLAYTIFMWFSFLFSGLLKLLFIFVSWNFFHIYSRDQWKSFKVWST